MISGPKQLVEMMDSWFGQLIIILLGYCSVIVPGYIFIQYIKRTRYIDQAGSYRFNKENISWNFEVFSCEFHLYFFNSLCKTFIIGFSLLTGSSIWSQLIISCVYGKSYDKIVDETVAKSSPKKESTMSSSLIQLSVCFFGLQFSYLTWGVLQEKIMTKVSLTNSLLW